MNIYEHLFETNTLYNIAVKIFGKIKASEEDYFSFDLPNNEEVTVEKITTDSASGMELQFELQDEDGSTIETRIVDYGEPEKQICSVIENLLLECSFFNERLMKIS